MLEAIFVGVFAMISFLPTLYIGVMFSLFGKNIYIQIVGVLFLVIAYFILITYIKFLRGVNTKDE